MVPEIYLVDKIRQLQQNNDNIIIAIDGRCASGKTTLASKLSMKLDLNILHMDDFFLRPEQRTKEREFEPGGNVDRERFLEEVLKPLKSSKSFSYRPYDSHIGGLADEIEIQPKSISIVEGSYSCHPALWDYYDLHIFMTVSKEEQINRLQTRNADCLTTFQQKWIPYEENYFAVYNLMESCEIVFTT